MAPHLANHPGYPARTKAHLLLDIYRFLFMEKQMAHAAAE
jgi:hypothetical protein